VLVPRQYARWAVPAFSSIAYRAGASLADIALVERLQALNAHDRATAVEKDKINGNVHVVVPKIAVYFSSDKGEDHALAWTQIITMHQTKFPAHAAVVAISRLKSWPAICICVDGSTAGEGAAAAPDRQDQADVKHR